MIVSNGQKRFLGRTTKSIKAQNKKPFIAYIAESFHWTQNIGRKKIDPLILFKILIIQQLLNLSDEEFEFQVNERQSFKEFIG